MKTLIVLIALVSINANASETKESCLAQGKAFVNASETVRGYRQAHCRKVRAPKCWKNTESCKNAWYNYGDITGDYGVVDVAE